MILAIMHNKAFINNSYSIWAGDQFYSWKYFCLLFLAYQQSTNTEYDQSNLLIDSVPLWFENGMLFCDGLSRERLKQII